MSKQSELIGNHPKKPNQFGKWLSCNDITPTPTKCHRELKELIPSSEDELIEWLARELINHHYSNYRLEKLKEKFRQIGYPKYAEQHRKLPKADRVKKGNATEVLLTEYIENCLGKKMQKVFKLKYNPNVDQAIKGDDTLMIDIIEARKMQKVKVYLGEAKFRQSPTRKVIQDITKALSKDKLPISYSFLVDVLGSDPNTKDIANILDDFLIEDIKGNGDLTYTGLLLSDENTSSKVEECLNSDNPKLVFISIGINNPEIFINKAFDKAEELISIPTKI